MAHLANCPQCDHDLLVPDGVALGSWVRCPGCQGFFQLKDARARELPTVEVVMAASDESTDSEIDQSQPTVADFSSAATLAEMAKIEAGVPDEIEERGLLNIDEPSTARPQSYDDLGFRELGALFDSNELAAESQPHSHADETIDLDDEPDSEVAHLHEADVEDDDVLDFDDIESTADGEAGEVATTEESPQAAAERIDAWFRSAKTLADVPPLEDPDVDYRADRESLFGPSPSAANNATVEIGSGGVHELSDDCELDAPTDAPQDIAAWDDTQHMEQLLADVEDQPQDEPLVAMERIASTRADHETKASEGWASSEIFPIVPKNGRPQRQRSLLRTLAMTVIGGVMGLGLGYYALLWLRGPEIDFLEAAKYLPQAILPSSFKPAPRPMAVAPPLQAKNDEAATETAEPPATDATANADTTTETTTPAAEPPAEKLATFNEPLGVTKPAEPAPFNEPPAAPLKESADIGEPIQIKGAPSFTEAELSAALAAGKDAETGLVAGSFVDSDEVKRAKGRSYMILADLAQKATFGGDSASGDSNTLQLAADDLFRRILSGERARNEIGQIVLLWIESPKRQHGGVFLAGNVRSCEARGQVSECSIALPGGQTLPVLIPAAFGEQAKASQTPVAVVGWIVDNPAKNVSGYTGSAERAIFAPKLIPLE